jgi:hypothetical protein
MLKIDCFWSKYCPKIELWNTLLISFSVSGLLVSVFFEVGIMTLFT